MRELLLAGRLLRHWTRRNRDDFADIIKTKLFITKRCNLQCRHCGIGEAAFPGFDELTTDQVLSLWRMNRQLQLLSLSGGEPFLRDDLVEVGIAAARSLPRLMVLSVNTNGWFTERIERFAREVCKNLPRHGQLFITCSSDGFKEAHALVRRSEESYERKEATIAALRKLAARAPALQIRHNVNVNRWNLATIAEYVEEREAHGEKCLISMYSASRHYAHKQKHHRELREFRLVLTQRKQLLRRLRKGSSFLGNRFLSLAEEFYDQYERKQPVPCFSLRASCIIEHDGTVRPCINFPIDLGRVQDHGFRLTAIVDSAKAGAHRAKIRLENCPICWTPNEAYVTMMCNLPNRDLWINPVEALSQLRSLRK